MSIPTPRLPNQFQEFLEKVTGVLDITVYRQFLPVVDAVEFTVLFWRDGEKWRIDLKEDSDVLTMLNDEQTEWYLTGKLVQLIDQSDYKPARNAVR